ncbi:MAG: ABC transporter ATP-binding protein [Candidatus Xenobium sp.]|jgi:ATP-binding cassette subfamily B multidrug efflux pump
MFKTLAPCLAGYRFVSWMASLTIAFEVLFEVTIPWLMADILDYGIARRDLPFILKRGGLMLGMAGLSMACGGCSARLAALGGTGFARGLRTALFDRVQGFSFASLDRFTTGSLLTRLTTDVTNTQNAFQIVIRMLVRSMVMLVAATLMALHINSELAGVFVVAIPFLAVCLTTLAFLAYPRFREMLRRLDFMNARVQESLVGLRVVRSFVREDHEKEQFFQAAGKVRDWQARAEGVVAVEAPISSLVLSGTLVAVLWFGGHLVVQGGMLPGELVSFVSYIGQILVSLMMLSFAFIGLVISKASVDRIMEVLRHPVEGLQDPPPLLSEDGPPTFPDGSLEFENVDFSYSANPRILTLTDIHFRIGSGQVLGLIGGTGSGKTTLVQLIPRLYEVTAGRIRVGGRDIRETSLEELRDAVAVVLQKNVLFSGTIAENLRWGRSEATLEELEKACRIAQAHDFITGFPDGYDTDLGQGGVNLSGGQKQRLCLARALLKKPRILILDDSTSAVDMATDARIRAALRSELQGMTVVVIAQRIASVREADAILVLDEGRVVGFGNHRELHASCPVYREACDSQHLGEL